MCIGIEVDEARNEVAIEDRLDPSEERVDPLVFDEFENVKLGSIDDFGPHVDSVHSMHNHFAEEGRSRSSACVPQNGLTQSGRLVECECH